MKTLRTSTCDSDLQELSWRAKKCMSRIQAMLSVFNTVILNADFS